MSIPVGPQNPYQPDGRQPGAGGYGFPQQAQPNNPYAQPPAAPPPGMSPYGPGALPLPGAGAGGAGRGRAGWLWGGLAGALLASAGWAGALLLTGNPPFARAGSPDFAGNHYVEDLCEVAGFAAFEERYGEPDTEAEPTGFSHEDRDASQCSVTYPAGAEYGSVYVTLDATWHRAVDPAPYFAGTWEMYNLYGSDGYAYDVGPYEKGPGDEAYLVTSTDTAEDRVVSVSLAVREGWLELSLSWSDWTGGETAGEEITEMLHQSAVDTLAALKESGGG
ncbi:hypothetical protein [Streptomyces sp. YIM 98790]|uniref:hypothetical protein n=1 Tax=Streptomyces sp. YIM 98790 TaxID=2689077 RepID=UPI00140E0AD7|nr:hypothetical protein [Streptomyces sp. YIM 98790]